MKNIIFNTNQQKILLTLIKSAKVELTEKDIFKAAKISRAGVNFAVADLVKEKLIKKIKKGRLSFYTLNFQSPLIKQLKIVANLLTLQSLIKRIQNISLKITLFGSAARGENISDSDIDLFIVSHRTKEVEEIISKNVLARKIQAIIKSPGQLVKFEKQNKTLIGEIERGIILWQQQ